MYGKTHTDEVKKFLSEINKGKNNYWYDKPEHMVKMRSAITKRFNGRKHTQETREKMSKARKGRKHHADTKKGLARHKKGKSIREEKSKRNQ